jgi:hypothetical protein
MVRSDWTVSYCLFVPVDKRTYITYLCHTCFTYLSLRDTLITNDQNHVAMQTLPYTDDQELITIDDLSEIEKKYRIKQIKQRIAERQYRQSSKPLYTDPIDLELMTEEYYKNGIKERTIIIGTGANTKESKVKLPTISGLVLFLGFESRTSFYEYEKVPALMYTIKKIRQGIEEHYEAHLFSSHTVGSIFALKNMSWTDKTEQTINQTIREVKVSVNQADTNDLINTI